MPAQTVNPTPSYARRSSATKLHRVASADPPGHRREAVTPAAGYTRNNHISSQGSAQKTRKDLRLQSSYPVPSGKIFTLSYFEKNCHAVPEL